MKWNNKFESIIFYSSKRIDRFSLDQETKDFLVNIGLPKDAAPFLSFVANNDKIYEGILKATDYFDFLEQDFSKFIIIGSNGNGDEIVIDTGDNCKIKVLDHENNFSEIFMNSSIVRLSQSLLIYQDFIDIIQKELGENALIDFKYSQKHLDFLKARLIENDAESLIGNTFWTKELEILFINKESFE